MVVVLVIGSGGALVVVVVVAQLLFYAHACMSILIICLVREESCGNDAVRVVVDVSALARAEKSGDVWWAAAET